MKTVYPIVMENVDNQIIVYIPDFEINTQGDNYAHAMEMARDAIGIVGIDMQDDGEALPIPSALIDVSTKHQGKDVSLVDVDFIAYRRQNDMRSVRRNVSLPAWLDAQASKSHVNVSAVLQKALINELDLQEA